MCIRDRTNAVLPALILNDLAEAAFEHAIRTDQISLPFGPSDPPGTVNDGPATSLVDCVMRPAERFGSAVGDATNRGLPVPEYVSAKISPAVSLVITHQYQPPVVRPPALAGRYAYPPDPKMFQKFVTTAALNENTPRVPEKLRPLLPPSPAKMTNGMPD